MPKDLPVVIRVCDAQNASRFVKMQQALAICHQHNFQHVVVPKARLQGDDLIVEERLSDKNASIIKGMAFYYANREFYEPAVREFAAFLCYGTLSDLAGHSRHILNFQTIANTPRFDNLLLYCTVHGQQPLYKIGVVDIETFKPNSPTPTPNEVDYALRTSIELFPYHFDAVIEVGRNFATLSNEDIEQLRQQSLKSLELYKTFCEILKTPTLIELNFDRKQELKQHIGIFLVNRHMNCLKDPFSFTRCFKNDSIEEDSIKEDALEFVDDVLPTMIDLAQEALNKILNKIIHNSSKDKLSDGEKIERRLFLSTMTHDLILTFDQQKIYSEQAKKLLDENYYQTIIFAIFREIFNQLAKGGELSYYKPQVYNANDLIFF